MTPFDPRHVFHIQMMATFEQYKINSKEDPEPAFAMRELMLLGGILTIIEAKTKVGAVADAKQALNLWIEKMSPEMRTRLGF